MTTTFGYTDDRLTTFGGKAIAYNAMGCPTTYEGKTATWSKGKLSRLSSGTRLAGMASHSYSYNGYGQRVSRSYSYTAGTSGLNPVPLGQLTASSRKYYYDHSGRLIAEDVIKTYYGEGTTTENIVFLYDESGIIGMVHTVGSTANTYYFQRNLQGDVVAIYDANGVLKAKYLYDAWGNCTISSETPSYDVANANPIRYRGYYYDDDTGLYYCNARYYSPKWRRFISPDDTAYLNHENVNGLNLYCYCNNDPVNYADPSGHSIIASILIGLAVSAVVGWGLSIAFDEQIAGGIGSVVGGASAVYTGIGLLAFGPVGWIAGGLLMTVGIGTLAWGANEIVAGVTGTNYIQSFTGMSSELYNGIYIGLNIASAIGTIAGNAYMRFANVSGTSNPGRTGKPFSRHSLLDNNGVKQYRFFDGHGKVWFDTDFRHGGNLKFPHYHGWTNGIKHDGHWTWLELIQWLITGGNKYVP